MKIHPESSATGTPWVEDPWTRVVRSVGGLPISDLLASRTGLPKTTDFLFREYNVIKELKRLSHDSHLDRDLPGKINKLFRRWIEERKIGPIYGVRQVNLQSLPRGCAEQIISLYRSPIRRRLDKANSQIKSTKNLLQIYNAFGLIILVHDGDYSITPEMVLTLVHRSIIGGSFSSINGLIYTNADMRAIVPGIPGDYKLFVPAYRDPARPVPAELLERIRLSWHREIEARVGTALPVVSVPDIGEFLGRFRYVSSSKKPDPEGPKRP